MYTCKFSRLYISPTARFCFSTFNMLSFWFSRYSLTAFGLDREANCCSFSFIFACATIILEWIPIHRTEKMRKGWNQNMQMKVDFWNPSNRYWCEYQPVSVEVWLHKTAYLVPQTRIEEYQPLPSKKNTYTHICKKKKKNHNYK